MKRSDSEFRSYVEGFGLQDARKRVTFQSLPPVLHLQLERSGDDTPLDAMIKVWITNTLDALWCNSNSTPKSDDRFEFPFEIDLAEFLDETADRTESWKYGLHDIIVHSGDLDGGHYFAFIKPDQCAQWLKFDDERVTLVTDREVLEGSTNARTLVYIRETMMDEVLAPLAKKDTPHLSKSLSDCSSKISGSFLFQNEDWMRSTCS